MKFSITTKMLGGCAFVLALLLVVAFLGWRSINMATGEVQAVSQENMQGAAELASAQQALYELRLQLPTFMVSDAQSQAALLADRPRWSKQVQDSIEAYRQLARTSSERQALQAWDRAYGQYVQDAPRFFELFQAGQKEAALAWRTEHTNPAASAAAETLSKLIEIQRQMAQTYQKQSASMANQMVWLLLGATAFAIAVSATATYAVARGMARNVRQVVAVSRRIVSEELPDLERALHLLAGGDLSYEVALHVAPVHVGGSDEIRVLADDFNAMVAGFQRLVAAYAEMRDSLRDMVGQVRNSSAGIAEASKQLDVTMSHSGSAVQQVADAIQQVAEGAQDTSQSAEGTNDAVKQLVQAIDSIARGATDQARQVQAASELVTQMAAGMKEVASSAQNVASSSEQTKAVAVTGSSAVEDTVGGMADIRSVVVQAADKVEELGRLGQKIGAVVETIDDIAEQTNLLALNAAIEAARAGEHGMGFAVVADEVRKLAERSQHETKAIAELIAEVQNRTQEAVRAMEMGSAKVQDGSAKADQAGQSLQKILGAVDATVQQVTSIAAAAQQLAGSSASVMSAMQEISMVVEQNTAATEEMAAQSSQVLEAIQTIADASVQQSATTEEVSASALEMSAHVEEVSAEAGALAETAEALSRLVSRFKLPAEAAFGASKDLQPLSAGDTLDGQAAQLNEQLERAISAHSKWKMRLKHAIETGRSDTSPAVVRQDNQCEFGKFLYNSISTAARRDRHYAEIKELHAKFHLQAAGILELAIAGSKAPAEDALATGSAYHKISSALVREIMDWQKHLALGSNGRNGQAAGRGGQDVPAKASVIA
ncbi:MAG: MCP four helix bundle domain-containing protein [Chloroflexota bacterium]|nr:MCP four helix bundle domain-containing protein [Chloroflexota bacterium]